ncbi:hypothetical protein LCGC14_0978840 [marine sediment metagenome]|uniref:Uncharacterized protein n=1 Tax=marine sediment metagenome TaxID=412755 RepID=A0A0F9NVM1_9ZZZZ
MPFSDSPLIDWHRKQDEEDLPLDEKEALLPEHNQTKLLLKDIKYRALNKRNFSLFVDADTGTGKTTIGSAIFDFYRKWLYNTNEGRKLIDYWVKKDQRKPRFDISNFVFSDYEFLDRLTKATPLEIVFKDEDYETSAQVGGRAMKERKSTLLRRLRGLQLNFILIDPIFKDDDLSKLYNYRLFANDKDQEEKKNRAILSLRNYDNVWNPVGNVIFDFVEIEGYEKKKDAQLDEVKKMAQPEYKRKQLKQIVDALVHWKNPETGATEDIRNIQKNSWNGTIKLRLDLMGKGGQRAGTEIKEIKDAIDGYYPMKKEKKKKD